MRNLKYLLPYLARYRASLILGLLVLLALSGTTLVQPYLLRLGIDGLQNGNFNAWVCLIIVFFGLIQMSLGFMQRRSINRTGHRIEADIRQDLFLQLQKLDRQFYDENSVGDLIVHSTSDISIQRNLIVQGVVSGFNTIFLGTIALALMFTMNWRLALVGLVFLPFLMLAFAKIRGKMEQHYQAAQERLGEVSNRVQEVFSGIRVVKAYTREEQETARYAEENRIYVSDRLKYARLNSFLLPLILLSMSLTTALLLWVGANEIQAGNLTLGQFVQFNAYLLLLAGPLSNLGLVFGIGQQAAISMGRLQRLLKYQAAITDPPLIETAKPDETSPTKPAHGFANGFKGANGKHDHRRTPLEFNHVGLRFGDRWVLRDISFKVEEGRTVAVVGPTGAGKSALAALIGRVYDPQEGQIVLDEQDVRDLPLSELRRKVAYVPQETLLFSLTLRENIAFGKSQADDDEVGQVAEMSRLSQDLPQIPGGFEAVVGDRGVTLSGGQKQRTAIARALLPDSTLLILDDALSSVDARTQNYIAANLKTLTEQGRTMLIVTQRLALVKDSDWIVVLDEGRIVAQGSHVQLMQQPNSLYARMYFHEMAAAENNFSEDAVLPDAPIAIKPGTTSPEKAQPGLAKIEATSREDEDEIMGKDYTGKKLSRLFGYIRRYWRLAALTAPIIVVGALLELVGPLLSKEIIDNHITPGKLEGIGWLLGIFVAAALGSFGFRYFRAYLMEIISQKVVRDLRVQLFDHLLRQSLAFFDRYSAGSLIGRLTSDMDAINDLLSNGAVAVVGDLITLGLIIVTMLILDWRLALVSLAILPILFGVTFSFRKIMRRAWRTSRRKYSILVGYMAENYTGMLTVQLFNRQPANFDKFDELNQDYYVSNVRIVTLMGLLLPLVTFLGSLANALLLLVGGWLFINTGNVTFGLLVAFFQYTERAFQPIRDIAERYTSFQAASTSCERIFGLLDRDSAVQDPPAPRPLVEGEATGQVRPDWAEVRFDKVGFGYDPEFPVLKEVSFEIKAGEKVAIVGPTGAGKTSTISLLGRHYDVQQGRITIGGVDIREVAQKDLRHHLALVLQDPVLFKGTIAENIRLGRVEMSDEELRQAAIYVGADHFIRQLPNGYDYELQERGTNISAGQRQLLSFARAIAYNPNAILILDEATSSVDSESEAVIQDALRKLLEGRTALIIAHRLSTIRDVDRVIVFERGQVIEMGTQAELIARRGFYFQLYRHQMSLTGSEGGNLKSKI